MKHFDSFRAGTNFKGWMYTIMKNVYLDQCRRKKLEPQALEVEGAVDAPPRLPTSEELSDNLKSALDRLSPNHRLLLFLCDVEGFSYKEISEMLGFPMGLPRFAPSRGPR